MEQNETDIILYIIFAVPIVLVAILALCRNVILPLLADRRYIKYEIARAYGRREKRHWKRELRKLYVGYIPLIGKPISKLIWG